MESAERSLMPCRSPSAVMAFPAESASAGLVALPDSGFAHATTNVVPRVASVSERSRGTLMRRGETRTETPSSGRGSLDSLRSLGMTVMICDMECECECLRLAIRLPRAVHGIGKHEILAAEWIERVRIAARRLRHTRKVENVVAHPRHDRQRRNAGDSTSILDPLKARILVARPRRLTEDEVGLDAGRLQVEPRRGAE